MAEKEGRRPVSSFAALIVGLLLIVSMALPFITVTEYSFGRYEGTYWDSGLTIAGGDPAFGIAGNSLVYLIPLGGIIGVLFAALALVPKTRLKVRVSWGLVFVGGLLALVGGIMTLLQLGPHFGARYGGLLYYAATVSLGIGLLGAVILGTVEFFVAAMMMILRE